MSDLEKYGFEIQDSIRMPTRELMSLGFINNQRDHKKRAPKKKYLHTYNPMHRLCVVAKILDEDITLRLDANTRTEVWGEGLLAPGEQVPDDTIVVPVVAKTRQKALDAYHTIDQSPAAKTSADDAHSVARKNDWKWKSTLLRNGLYVSAARMAWKIINNQWPPDKTLSVEMVSEFFEQELRRLDDLDLPAKAFPAGLIAAMIVSFYKWHEDVVDPIWQTLRKPGGASEKDGRVNFYALIDRYIEKRRNNEALGGGGGLKAVASFTLHHLQAIIINHIDPSKETFDKPHRSRIWPNCLSDEQAKKAWRYFHAVRP